MYVIAVYGVGKKRCNKMLKVCRRFLIHIQNSVFEGEITEANLERLKAETLEIMDSNYCGQPHYFFIIGVFSAMIK